MSREERIEAIKWNILDLESKINELRREKGKHTSYNHGSYIEIFDTTDEYDKYIIGNLIKDYEREMQLDLNRLYQLEREVEAYV